MEEWRTLDEFPDYAVSSYGRVQRITPAQGTIKGHILSPTMALDGYRRVKIPNADGVTKIKKVHQFVCEAFHGVKPTPEHQVNHKSGDKDDNHKDNLEWMTPSQNQKHAYKIGLKFPRYQRGEASPVNKLTEKNVLEIRMLLNHSSYKQYQIAKIFGVCKQTITNIKLAHNWVHI